MSKEIIKVPDLGGAEAVEVVELNIEVGDVIDKDDTLIVVETDKASMEIPSPKAGKVVAVLVKEGDSLQQETAIIELEVEGGDSVGGNEAVTEAPAESEAVTPAEPTAAPAPVAASGPQLQDVLLPDVGTEDPVEVIEVCVSVGDEVSKDDSLVVLETDKASMEIPSPYSGVIKSIALKEGDTVKKGTLILTIEAEGVAAAAPVADSKSVQTEASVETESREQAAPSQKELSAKAFQDHQAFTGMSESRPSGQVYAGPAVRKMAREVGLDLALVEGKGPKGRIQKEDVKAYLKDALAQKKASDAGFAPTGGGSGIPAVPAIDFSQFGEITLEKMSRMHKITAENMHRSWLNVPHVTAFDECDITELEDFRKSLKSEAEREGVKVTPLPFILKACAIALKAHPKLNASLHSDGENVVYKHYVHIGIAVDTPAGLMVPVIRDVDKKSIFELAAESVELAEKAKDRKLQPKDMQGGTFTVSSLGAMGGTGFTPIVNTPESAILGVSKLDIKPRWNGKEFEPRKMLPIALSYDHRMVNGADAGKFMVMLNGLLSDIRRLAL